MNKINKLIFTVLLALSLGFNTWNYFKVKSYEKAINNQGAVITLQQAAWQILLSSLTPAQQQVFTAQVDALLKQ